MRASLIFGAINGLTYALLALGLVLVFKAGRFVNFAHAQMGVMSALLLGKLVIDWGVPWLAAFCLALGAGVGIGAVTEVLVIRRLARRSPMSRLIASIGIAQVLLAATFWSWLGPDRVRLSNEGYPLPFNTRIDVDQLTLGTQHVLTVLLVPAIAGGLALFFRTTITGKAIRAAAVNPDAAGLAGIPVARVSQLTWMIAGGLAAISAILAAPGQPAFDTEALGPALMLRAIGAAAIAGFTSLPTAAAAGIGLGVLEGFVLHTTGNAGLASAWLFVAILVGLLARSGAIERATGGRRDSIVVEAARPPIPEMIRDRFVARRSRLLLGAAAIYVAILAPWIPAWRTEATLFILSTTVILAIVAVSLTILTGWSGQVSLGQFAFVGVGAFVGSRLIGEGWSLPAAVLVAGLVGAVVAVVIGLPALRLPGLTLAVSTMGFSVVAPAWLFRQPWFTSTHTTAVPAPEVLGLGAIEDQRATYYVAVAVLTIAVVAASRLRRSAPGRLVVAVRDNEQAAASLGVSPTAVKLTAFAISGAIAASAGALWATAWRSVSIDAFSPQQSLVVLSVAVIGGVSSLPGAVLGAIVVIGIPALTHDWVRSLVDSAVQLQLFLAGLGLIVTQVVHPGGLAEVAGERWHRFLLLLARQARPRSGHSTSSAHVALEVDDVRVIFGGVTAVDGISLHVGAGEIVGLIGTNGAGKTTLLNAISGNVAAEGSVRVFGEEIGDLPSELRAHAGVGRSFQDARLFAGLTVTESVQVALARHEPVGAMAAMTGAPWVRFTERRSLARAREIIHSLGLDDWSDIRTGDLSTGTRRICDLALQVAAQPRLLLLDEPTAGVAQREAEQFGPLLRRLAEDIGCSIVLIEHDMPLILGVADRIYCLEQGRVIAEGTPEAIRNDPRVIASYLGTDGTAIARSGPARIATGSRRPRRSQPLNPARIESR